MFNTKNRITDNQYGIEEGMIVTFVDKSPRLQKIPKLYMNGPLVVSELNKHKNQVKLRHMLNNRTYVRKLRDVIPYKNEEMLKYSRETKDQLFGLPGAEINRYPDLILRWPESLDKITPTMLQTPIISRHPPDIDGQDEDNDNGDKDFHEDSTEEAHKLPADIDAETNDVVTFDTRPDEQYIYDQ